MACCCVTTFDLCNVRACDALGLVIPLNAITAGVHLLVLTFLGATYTLSKTFGQGDALIFSTVGLNEFQEYEGRIYNPAGDLLSVEESECIKFTVQQNFTL